MLHYQEKYHGSFRHCDAPKFVEDWKNGGIEEYGKIKMQLHKADGRLALPYRKGVLHMVTYEAMNMLFQFGIFLVTALTAVVAIVALVTNIKKK